MSELRKKLRAIAEEELDGMIVQISKEADSATEESMINGPELLRLAAGGKVQVLRTEAINALIRAKERNILTILQKEGE